MDKETVISILRKENLISGTSPKFRPLKGGVSSEIFVVTDRENSLVVKQALPKLKVKDDWFADISRNENEQRFLRFLERYRPKAAPSLFYSDDQHHFFVMEFLDEGFWNWKEEMLKGVFNPETAKKSAELLADIHLKSRGNEEIEKEFAKAENFYCLRTEPYLVTTGKRHPDLKEIFFKEAERLNNHREALVHGDFSPKNIMVKENRIVLLDHEVAWYGDPAFDLAFFLTHLYLKMLYHFKNNSEIQDLTSVAWNAYLRKDDQNQGQMKVRANRLLLMIMLARIDGKSPVEYLEKTEKEFVRSFVKTHLLNRSFLQDEINKNWKEKIKQTYS